MIELGMHEAASFPFIPSSKNEAVDSVRALLRRRPDMSAISRDTFLKGWGAIFYLAPGLHPDEYDNPTGGWPTGWRQLGAEAFRRSSAGQLTDSELYPCDCQRAGLRHRV